MIDSLKSKISSVRLRKNPRNSDKQTGYNSILDPVQEQEQEDGPAINRSSPAAYDASLEVQKALLRQEEEKARARVLAEEGQRRLAAAQLKAAEDESRYWAERERRDTEEQGRLRALSLQRRREEDERRRIDAERHQQEEYERRRREEIARIEAVRRDEKEREIRRQKAAERAQLEKLEEASRRAEEAKRAEEADLQRIAAERRRNASSEQIRHLRGLIRKKYSLDVEVWDNRNVQIYDRALVIEQYTQSDKILQDILLIVNSWDQDLFEDQEEWKIAKKIKSSFSPKQSHSLPPQFPLWRDCEPWDPRRGAKEK